MRWSELIDYFPFFFAVVFFAAVFFAAAFFAVDFFATVFLATVLRPVFFAADLRVDFFAAAFFSLGDLSCCSTECAGLDDHDIGPQDVVGRDIGERHHVSRRKIPSAHVDVVIHAVGEDEHFLVRYADRREKRLKL